MGKPNAPQTNHIPPMSAMPLNMITGDRRRKALAAMLAAATLAHCGSLPAAEIEAVLLSGNGAPDIPGFPNMNGVYRMDVNNRGGSFGASDDGGYVVFSAYWNGLSGLFRIKVPDPVSLKINLATGASGPLRLSCIPRADVTGVQLQESPDLVTWQPPTGQPGLPIPRPAAGWNPTPITWEIQPGVEPRFFRVTGSKN